MCADRQPLPLYHHQHPHHYRQHLRSSYYNKRHLNRTRDNNLHHHQSMRRNSPASSRERASPHTSPRQTPTPYGPIINTRLRSSSNEFSSPLPPPSSLLTPITSPLSAPRSSNSPAKACGWCGSSSTTQWRIGQTDGSPAMSLLCNACGINYRRALSKSKGNVNLDDLARAMGPITAPCRPSIHKSLKRQRAAASAAAEAAAAATMVTNAEPAGSSSTRKRTRYSSDRLPPFDALLRSIPDPTHGQRPP